MYPGTTNETFNFICWQSRNFVKKIFVDVLFIFIYLFFLGENFHFSNWCQVMIVSSSSCNFFFFFFFFNFFVILHHLPIFSIIYFQSHVSNKLKDFQHYWVNLLMGTEKMKKKRNYKLIDGFGYIYFVNIAHLNLTISMNSWMISVCAILIYLRFAVITFTNRKWKQIRYTWPYTYKCTHVRTTKTTTPAQRFYLIFTVYFKIITQSPIYSIENFYFLFVANRLLNA